MRAQKHDSYRINLKLNPELDADLIAWLEQHAPGTRSEAVRQALRVAIGLIPPPLSDREAIAEVIRQSIAETLAELQIVAAQQGTEVDVNELEDAFGAQLDSLLGSFS